MIDDKRAAFEGNTHFLCAFPCHGAAVENMSAADLGGVGHAGDPCDRDQLVYRNGVIDHCRYAERASDSVSKHTGKVGDMNIDLCRVEIVDHLLIDYKCTGRNGGQEPSASHNTGKGGLIDALFLKGLIDMLHTVFKLIHDPSVMLELIG